MGRKKSARQWNVRGETKCHSDHMPYQSNEEHLGDLTCPICLRVFVEPRQCKQGHVFCKACIERTLEGKEECPMDRSKLRVADLSHARVVETLMDRMRVRCPQASQHADGADDCRWLGTVSERRAHVDDECRYTLVPCPHDGCEVRVQRRVVSEHAASCEQRVEACKLCSMNVVVAHHAQHEEECPMGTVVCPRLGCEALSRRKDTAEHETVCPMVQVECAFAVCGCTVGTLLRKDVAGHEKDAAAVHAALALQLKPETVSLKQEVRTLQAQLKRSAEAPMGPVSVRWRVENVEAKIASGGNFLSKEIQMWSATVPQTLLRFKVEITFKNKKPKNMGLYIKSSCGNPTYLGGTSVALCYADSNEGDKRKKKVRKFNSNTVVKPRCSTGWAVFVSEARLRESHVAADGSITILATLATRQVLDV